MKSVPGYLAISLLLLFGAVPFSIACGLPVCLAMLAWGLGRYYSQPDTDDREPPWGLLLVGMSILLGSLLSVGWVVLMSRTAR